MCHVLSHILQVLFKKNIWKTKCLWFHDTVLVPKNKNPCWRRIMGAQWTIQGTLSCTHTCPWILCSFTTGFHGNQGKARCVRVCVSVCACTRNREQEREFAGKKLLAPYRAHSIFNTWLFPLKFKHGVIFNDKRMLEVKGCNYSGVKFRGKLMWGHIAMQQSNVLWKVAKQ